MNTKVAIVSLKKLYTLLLIAGPVAKIPTTLPSLTSFAFLNCAPYWMITKTAPTKAPKNYFGMININKTNLRIDLISMAILDPMGRIQRLRMGL